MLLLFLELATAETVPRNHNHNHLLKIVNYKTGPPYYKGVNLGFSVSRFLGFSVSF